MTASREKEQPCYVNKGFEESEEKKRPPSFNPNLVKETQYVIETVAPPLPKPKSCKKKCCNYTKVSVIVLLVLGLCVLILLTYYFLSPCGANAVWCGNGLCVKWEEWCDGTPQCSNGQDEAKCTRLSGTGFLLQVYSRSSHTWRSVCADGWTDEFGRQACENIGYSRDTYVSSGQIDQAASSSQGFLTLKSNANPDAPLLVNLHSSDTCPSGKTVTLRCIACGSTSSPHSDRIVGGQEAPKGAWPWQVVLREKTSSTFCGGSIITPYWILTAAQCAQRNPDPSSWRVYTRINAGALFDFSFSPFENVAVVITYPKYNNKTHNNDIALMKLQNPLQMSDSLRPICLLNVDMQFSPPQSCWIVGFGRTSEGGAAASKLMETQVTLISTAVCNSPDVYNGKITNSMVCAGNLTGGVDRCEGDEGGPLMAERDSLWWLVGAGSWGQGCGRGKKPGVYGNVAYFLDWIYAEMKSHRGG